MSRLRIGLLMLVALAGFRIEPARAGVLDRAFRAAAERLVRVGGQEVAREGEEVLARRVGTLAVRKGDEALEVIGQGGPRALRFVEGASEPASQFERLLIREGDSAIPVLIRPGWITEPVVEAFGAPAARALETVGSRSARLLARTAGSGKFARTGRTARLLKAVGQHGDRAMNWVWRNKGALAVTAGLVAFVRDPGPFLDGFRDLAGVLVREVARPVAQIPGQVVTEVVRRLDWTIPAVLLAALVVIVGVRQGIMACRRCPRINKEVGKERAAGKRSERPRREHGDQEKLGSSLG